MGSATNVGSTDSKTRGCQPKNPLTRIFVVVILLVCRFGLLHGFDRKDSHASRWKGTSYSSILDLVVKGYSDHSVTKRISNDTSLGGQVRDFWSRGRRRSASMMEGVRKSYELRGGDHALLLSSSSWSLSRDPIPTLHPPSSTQAQSPSPSAIDVDGWARDFTMLLAWIVAFQATSAGIYSRRRSLFEVRAWLLPIFFPAFFTVDVQCSVVDSTSFLPFLHSWLLGCFKLIQCRVLERFRK